MKYFIILCFLPASVISFDLFSGITFTVGAGLSYLYGTSIKNVAHIAMCDTSLGRLNLYECCGSPWIRNNIEGLIVDLKEHLFGQHIVQQIIPAAIAASIGKTKPSKPLVMSFHGWTGNGKNYVTSFIVKHFFKKGMDSSFFHYFNGRLHFPSTKNVALYQSQLRSWISENVTACSYSVFVFDEVEKIPPGVLDSIKPFMDHHENVNGVDFRRAIFIFMSNIGGTIITERYLELWRKYGKTREQMTLTDFDNVINRGAFNEAGGLQMSDIIDHNLIDHYVPFLPMEKIHVEQCIRAELRKHFYRQDDGILEEVMKVVTFSPSPEGLFSSTGCKRLSQKVAALVYQRMMQSNEF